MEEAISVVHEHLEVSSPIELRACSVSREQGRTAFVQHCVQAVENLNLFIDDEGCYVAKL